MSLYSRRDFLATASLAAAGVTIGPRVLSALTLRSPSAANAFLPPSGALPEQLRRLAQIALDAARAAGASYADVRLAEVDHLSMSLGSGLDAGVTIGREIGYGIRVLANGAWAFAHGETPDPAVVAAAARNVVATARGYARIGVGHSALIPAPSIQGEYTTPHEIDPFTVPLQHHASVLHACNTAAARLPGSRGQSRVAWSRETRIVATTEGTLVTQRLYRFRPEIAVIVDRGMGRVGMNPHGLTAASGGFELFPIDLAEHVYEAGEEASRLASLPIRPMEVGRYPIIFDGATLGAVLGETLGQTLELDRILGEEADASGTSLFPSVTASAGASLFSAQLTVDSRPPASGVTYMKWDDEGIESKPYTMIDRGRVVDYHTSRQTAGVLRDWYAGQSKPIGSHGCLVAPTPTAHPSIRSPHLNVAPAKTDVSIEDLCRGVPRGMLVQHGRPRSVNHQQSSGNISGQMLAISQGKITHRVRGSLVQFHTMRLWKALSAVGGQNTMERGSFSTTKGQPWVKYEQTSDAPAGLFSSVDVIQLPARGSVI